MSSSHVHFDPRQYYDDEQEYFIDEYKKSQYHELLKKIPDSFSKNKFPEAYKSLSEIVGMKVPEEIFIKFRGKQLLIALLLFIENKKKGYVLLTDFVEKFNFKRNEVHFTVNKFKDECLMLHVIETRALSRKKSSAKLIRFVGGYKGDYEVFLKKEIKIQKLALVLIALALNSKKGVLAILKVALAKKLSKRYLHAKEKNNQTPDLEMKLTRSEFLKISSKNRKTNVRDIISSIPKFSVKSIWKIKNKFTQLSRYQNWKLFSFLDDITKELCSFYKIVREQGIKKLRFINLDSIRFLLKNNCITVN
ncbi:hypothetical protein C4M96_03625 [Mycoplasmopsis pullorum]|uniref:hypothetical protein n=1 Tax=Mycoplasmopsis pullorum TaxID=48003 RepID=UPI0011199FC0|nr:hypothetical protein [Mycoplasmopsis pullorum]TNK83582.1 hypothetical protein C4M93_02045 [Mycoplasmopsis pullorum]TNK91720.1 hypothetical protein C4M96_03625 [Mycoplasmopsis pullorum]